jgi:hypothetical protein
MNKGGLSDANPELGSFVEPPPLQSAALDADRFRILKRPVAAEPPPRTPPPPAPAPSRAGQAPAPTQPSRWPPR